MSTALFDLISSLSQSEKRYFVRFASLHSGTPDSSYYRLYRSIEKSKLYDAERLKSEFGRTHFEQLKKVLYNKLLTCLRLYHEDSQDDSGAWSHYANSRQLFRRNIMRYALRERALSEKAAEEQELNALSLHFPNAEINAVMLNSDDTELTKGLKRYTEKNEHLLRALQNRSKYTSLLIQVEVLNRKFEGTRDAQEYILIARFLQNNLLKQMPAGCDAMSGLMFGFCNGLGNYLRCDFESSAAHFESCLTMLRNRSYLHEQDPIFPARILANCALANFHAGRLTKFRESLNELKAYSERKGVMQQYSRELVLILEMMELNREKKYAEAMRKFRRVGKSDLVVIRPDELNQREIYFAFQEAIALRGAGELRKASARIAAFISRRGKLMKQDAYVTARIVFLLLRFELGDESLTQSELRSVSAELLRRQKFYQVERSLISFVRDMMTLSVLQERKQRRNKLLSELKALQQIPYERNAFLYFDFNDWAATYDVKN